MVTVTSMNTSVGIATSMAPSMSILQHGRQHPPLSAALGLCPPRAHPCPPVPPPPGFLSFYNARTKQLLHTFKAKFSQPVLPAFMVRGAGLGQGWGLWGELPALCSAP